MYDLWERAQECATNYQLNLEYWRDIHTRELDQNGKVKGTQAYDSLMNDSGVVLKDMRKELFDKLVTLFPTILVRA